MDPLKIGMDFCTTCEGSGCPDEKSAPKDDRPGNQVGQIMWKPESEGDRPPQSSATEDIMGEDEEDLFAAYDLDY